MTEKEMYEAVVHNDGNYDGLFFYGVKSTGIYCRPSCQSKKPLKENVCFFQSAEEAVAKGFRPCKRCRSDLMSYQPMEEIAEELKRNLEALCKKQGTWKQELHTIGLSEHRLVDIFKETYGMTPKGYMDRLKLEKVKQLLTETDDRVIDIAASVGFGGLSTFNRFFKMQTGISPSAYRKCNSIK